MAVKKQLIWVHGCNGQIQDPSEVSLIPVGQGAIIKDIAKHERYPVGFEGLAAKAKPNFSWVHYSVPTPSAHLYKLGKGPYEKSAKASGNKPSLEAILVRFKCSTEITWGRTEFSSALAALHVWDAETKLHSFYNLNVHPNQHGDDEEFGIAEKEWTDMVFRLPEKISLNYGINIAICMRFDILAYEATPLFYISSVGAQFASVP